MCYLSIGLVEGIIILKNCVLNCKSSNAVYDFDIPCVICEEVCILCDITIFPRVPILATHKHGTSVS